MVDVVAEIKVNVGTQLPTTELLLFTGMDTRKTF